MKAGNRRLKNRRATTDEHRSGNEVLSKGTVSQYFANR